MMKHTLVFFISIILSLSCNSQTQNNGLSTSNQPISYDDLKKESSTKKAELKKKYQERSSDAENQKEVIEEARKYLLSAINTYFKAWNNTPWDFNGTTKTPKQGKIACGYFVTNILQDIGLNIPRTYWAQQTSEYMIKKMTSDIKLFRKKPMTDVVDYIKTKGEGLYVVGLDCHVGYIYYWDGKMNFVHSNYYQPKIGVMSEPLIGRNPLNDSKYRIVGKIFDTEMIEKWMMDTPYSK